MKKTINLIAIAILISLSFLIAKAQEQTIVSAIETSTGVEKSAKKTEASKKRQSNNEDSWNGFYLGGFGGYTNGKANANTSTAFVENAYFATSSVSVINTAGNQKLKSNGFNGGVTAGFNYQNGKFFIGGEFDFGSNRINKSVSVTAPYPCCVTTNFTLSQTVKSDWLLTARPRVGVALKKSLLYLTGGLAVTNVKYDAQFTDTFGPALENGNFKKTKTGGTIGGGMEFKVDNHWSVKAEYLFSQFKRDSISVTGFQTAVTGSRATNTFTHSTDLKFHNLRFGLNYRF